MALSLENTFNEAFRLPFSFRKDGTTLKVSQNFWDWIKWHEGDPKKKGYPILTTYKDSVGVWTIGYGHTGPDVKPGMKITPQQALAYLYADAKVAADCVRRILGEWKAAKFPGYKVKQSEFDALVSIVFNSGCSSVRNSVFIQNLKKADYRKTAKNILYHKNKGLANRRRAESLMFSDSNYLKM